MVNLSMTMLLMRMFPLPIKKARHSEMLIGEILTEICPEGNRINSPPRMVLLIQLMCKDVLDGNPLMLSRKPSRLQPNLLRIMSDYL